jgi:signal transduction histidine kinase
MSWRWPTIRKRPALVLFAVFLAIGLWNANTVWLDELADGSRTPASRFYTWELTGALSAYLLLPIVRTAVLNAPVAARRWGRFLAVHVVGYATYCAAHVALMVGSREVIYALMGWGSYDYGPLGLRVPMEWHKDLLSYGIFVMAIEGTMLWRRTQTRKLREAELEARLREAQLRALSAQLDPHFLFNALNTVSSLMYEDLGRTDRLLSDLGKLLRASLEAAGPSWTLEEERLHTERYVAIVLARFGDRLSCTIEVDPALGRAPVPRFLLQRLVENAIKHNPDPPAHLSVSVRARRVGEALEIEVTDDGRGFPESGARRGVGLSGLEESLALLHGERASLHVARGPEGGARVRVTLPAEVPK